MVTTADKIPSPNPLRGVPPIVESPDILQVSPTPPKKLEKLKIISLLTTVIVFAVFVTSILLVVNLSLQQNQPGQGLSQNGNAQKLEKFASEEEFKKYLEEGIALSEGLGSIGAREMSLDSAPSTGSNFGAIAAPTLKTEQVTRVSETNVQVKGIDEPDILKTDGKNIFFSAQNYGYGRPIPLENFRSPNADVMYPVEPIEYQGPETKVISAFPPENLKVISKITESGDFLLSDKNLIVFSGQKVVGYNISNPSSPSQSWRMDLKDNSYYVTSRKMGDFIYLVTSTGVTSYDSCIKPLIGGTREISIVCTDIYKPYYPAPSDATYTVLKINPGSGEVINKTSFLGSSGASVTYMSPNAFYVTYVVTEGVFEIITDFFTDEGKNFFPNNLIERVEKVKSYDLSFETKMLEIQKILEEYQNSLSSDERARLENEVQNKMEDYIKRRSREIIQTAIARIDINTFNATTSKLIPGTPLNQFSLDEYNGFLRIATTVGGGMFGSDTSANDVYVLDGSLSTVGSVKDLGLTERIYSVRFVADKGYVVTFRQIDPFYVIDLADPKNPSMAGQLKIPGYSGYLHPINKDKIIGVGMEGGNVKLSLFNVQNPVNPIEASKYNLDEYYSEAVSNHHAFLLDPENEIFFMPGGKGGYIFGYGNDTFSLKRVVSDMIAKRAIYINNYLYVVGDDKIVVLSLDKYEEVSRLTF